MEITAADVAPKAIIRESLSVTGGTDKEKAARAAGKRVVDTVAKEGWKKAAEEAQRKKPIEQRDIDRKLDEIGVGRDAAGKKSRTREEEARFDRAKDATRLAKQVIEQGYDRLNSRDQDTLGDHVEDAIRANPLLATEFNSLNPAERQREIERRLRDPKFLADLSVEVSAQLDPNKKLIEEAKIEERENDAKEKEFKKTEAETAVTDLTTQLKDLNTALQNFDASTVPPGKYVVELKDLVVREPTLRTELSAYETDLQNLQADLQELAADRRSLGNAKTPDPTSISTKDAEITSKRAEIRTKQGDIDSRRKSLGRITELQTEEKSLRAKKLETETSKKTKEMDLKKADLELSKSQRRLDDLRRERAYEEEDLVSSLEGVFARTADKYVIDEFHAIEAPVNAEVEGSKNKAANADEQAVYNAERKRWEKIKNPGKKNEEIMISKEKTEVDFTDLIRSGSPDNVIRQMLKTQVNTRTGVNYTDADIDVLLADKADGGFYKKMAPDVITQILKRKILAGGMTRADVFNIQNSTWGEGMIKNALEKNKAAAAELEALTGEKAVDSGFMPKLWEQTKKRPWLLLTLLGVVALPILAAKEGTSSIVK